MVLCVLLAPFLGAVHLGRLDLAVAIGMMIKEMMGAQVRVACHTHTAIAKMTGD